MFLTGSSATSEMKDRDRSSRVPKSIIGCSEPPEIPHAVIINQEQQRFFDAGTKVQYECEDGYTVERDETKTITCIAGHWTKGPTCLTPCGVVPVVPDAVVMEEKPTFVRYRCSVYYTQVGPEIVTCNRSEWTQLPTCKERKTFCEVDPALYGRQLSLSAVVRIKEGHWMDIQCVQSYIFSRVECLNGQIHYTTCSPSCSAPRLVGGFFVPKQQNYSHGAKLTYTCYDGWKLPVKGWWATSTCQNGKWSHEPQCLESINECSEPPKIPHAVIINVEHQEFFAAGTKVQYECEDGYTVHRDRTKNITCIAGNWTRGPTCQSITACSEPPEIPHAVIINQEHQEFFAAGTKVQYECEDGYTVERDETKTITCIAGHWTNGPTCRAAEVEKAVEPATSDDRNPARGGSSANSGMNDRDGSSRVPITTCGDVPVVQDAVIDEKRTFVRYRCSVFYTQVGPELVYCNSNGRWTQLPTCKVRERFCEVDPALYQRLAISISEVVRITEGQQKMIPCIWQGAYPHCTLLSDESVALKMSIKYLGVFLLIWFPGILHGSSATSEMNDRDRSSRVPKSIIGCSEPPEIHHAVIINQEQQRFFDAGTKLQYECEDGYTVERDETKTITCIAGHWTKGPTCLTPCGVVPVVPDAVVIEEKPTFVRYRCSVYYTQVGPEIVTCNSSEWTQLPTCKERKRFCEVDPALYGRQLSLSAVVRIKEGHWMDIPCVQSYIFSRVECLNGQIHYTTCSPSCSAPRLVGGFFVPKQQNYSHGAKLTYTCNDGWKLPVKGWWATSTCQNGKWSHEPQCLGSSSSPGPTGPAIVPTDFCHVDTALYPELKPTGSYFLRDGEKKKLKCVRDPEWYTDHFVDFECNDGRLTRSPECCQRLLSYSIGC
ncbi:complement factor H-like [Centropristis striata]|uniref:complement factor H-like n=1 Tax=Centropristis striata TaxID=184440 RepID=UPI0027E21571|nr:complement factor H-like [Centropristis striata]